MLKRFAYFRHRVSSNFLQFSSLPRIFYSSMGNLCSSSKPAPPASSSTPSEQKFSSVDAAPLTAAEPEKKLDPKDFFISKRVGETIVRLPGSVAGQALVIEDCSNCRIFLFDHSAALTIDECENCTFFIGPCESSVFIRTVKNSRFMVAAQQIRLRDCSSLLVSSFISAGQPVIETSKDIKFGCFDLNYFGLAQQFHSAGLSEWNSDWSKIHDFSAKLNEPTGNWEFLPPETGRKEILGDLSEVVGAEGDGAPKLEILPGWCSPLTFGCRPEVKLSNSALVFINGAAHVGAFLSKIQGGEDSETICRGMSNRDNCKLIRTRQVRKDSPKDEETEIIITGNKKLRGAQIIGMEINGGEKYSTKEELIKQLEEWAVEVVGEQRQKLVLITDNSDDIQMFFEPASAMSNLFN